MSSSSRPQRLRTVHDPLAWQNASASQRKRVLLLGMSYPDVEYQLVNLQAENKTRSYLEDGEGTLEQVKMDVDKTVKLVVRKILTEMDGRDLARCLSLEKSDEWESYCVSLESGSQYSRMKHLSANFNKHNFVKQLNEMWGTNSALSFSQCSEGGGRKVRKFSQVILDYYWIPTGSWAMQHWKRSFFLTTIPQFVTMNVLEDDGVVYLPFCMQCFNQLVSCLEEIAACYNIHLLYKGELEEVSLWKTTQNIDANVMQHVFGKALDQEEQYCKLTLGDLRSGGDDEFVCKNDIIKCYERIDQPEEVRYLALRVKKEDETGGFVHMKPGFARVRKAVPVKVNMMNGTNWLDKEGEKFVDEHDLSLVPTFEQLSSTFNHPHTIMSLFRAWQQSPYFTLSMADPRVGHLVPVPQWCLDVCHDLMWRPGPSHVFSKRLVNPKICTLDEESILADYVDEFGNDWSKIATLEGMERWNVGIIASKGSKLLSKGSKPKAIKQATALEIVAIRSTFVLRKEEERRARVEERNAQLLEAMDKALRRREREAMYRNDDRTAERKEQAKLEKQARVDAGVKARVKALEDKLYDEQCEQVFKEVRKMRGEEANLKLQQAEELGGKERENDIMDTDMYSKEEEMEGGKRIMYVDVGILDFRKEEEEVMECWDGSGGQQAVISLLQQGQDVGPAEFPTGVSEGIGGEEQDVSISFLGLPIAAVQPQTADQNNDPSGSITGSVTATSTAATTFNKRSSSPTSRPFPPSQTHQPSSNDTVFLANGQTFSKIVKKKLKVSNDSSSVSSLMPIEGGEVKAREQAALHRQDAIRSLTVTPSPGSSQEQQQQVEEFGGADGNKTLVGEKHGSGGEPVVSASDNSTQAMEV